MFAELLSIYIVFHNFIIDLIIPIIEFGVAIFIEIVNIRNSIYLVYYDLTITQVRQLKRNVTAFFFGALLACLWERTLLHQ
jgi:hypothetical protein